MKFRWQFPVSFLILVVGIAGLVSYDFYFRPYVLAKKVLVAKTDIPFNKLVTADDLIYKSVPNELVPQEAIFDAQTVIGKAAILSISKGSQLTRNMFDMDDLHPKEGEVIFPVPKEALFAVNGSLRKRDLVDIVLFKEEESSYAASEASVETQLTQMPDDIKPIIEKVPVVFARSEDNQNVKDTEKGDTNQRDTATGRISNVELLITKEQRDLLIEKVAEGYLIWITRVGS